MNARKCVHAQKPYPSQAFAHESSKVGGRGKRETGKTEARRMMERKAKQNTSEELKQGLPGTDRLTKVRQERCPNIHQSQLKSATVWLTAWHEDLTIGMANIIPPLIYN